MTAKQTALRNLAAQAAECRACDLWQNATQTVFGEGTGQASMILVGEQPGDQEDLQGKPFVGPAGRLLDEAILQAGLDRPRLYVTNAVKHFKFEPRGKRRIHQRPNRQEVLACRRWLDAEFALISPTAVVVALGATAGQALLGAGFRVGASRGADLQFEGRPLVATIHPSAILRANGSDREALLAGLVEDLMRAATLVTA
ncbi:MAG: phage polymerase-related protein [Acidimicrobiia bacterium]|nr:phage polymerase-related protein [Acidimicrobiia bacterium]